MNAISALHAQAVFNRSPKNPSALPPQPGPSQGHSNPAQSARTALVDRPDLAAKPFGSLVSLFAKGLPLPPFENAGETDPAVSPDASDDLSQSTPDNAAG